MNNYTNDTLLATACQLRHHIIATLYCIFFSWNIFFSVLVLTTIVKLGHSKDEFRNAYYQLLVNLLTVDAAYFSLYFIGSLPNVLPLTCRKAFNEMGQILLGLGHLVVTSALITNILFITVHRYIAVTDSNSEEIVSTTKILAMKMVIWFAGPFVAAVNFLVGGCLTKFNASNPSFNVKCTSISPTVTPGGIYNYSGIYGSLFLYLICIKKLRARSSQVQSEGIAQRMYKRQMQILLQATTICLSYTVSLTTFRLLPYIADEILYDLSQITVGLIGVYLTPVISVAFSSKLRSSLRSYLPNVKVQDSSTVATGGGSANTKK